MASLDGGRHLSGLAGRWAGTVLPEPGGRDDGGPGHGDRERVRAGRAPNVLFPTRIYGGGVDNSQSRQYDVAPEGRYPINTVLDEATAPITLIHNWTRETMK